MMGIKDIDKSRRSRAKIWTAHEKSCHERDEERFYTF
jgi:hypothetical protein